ncbi:hypothetical protein RvY_07353 [Ramazzottius varieornatus]|uniref:Uncharacterized protein n=1 Tax=Ramazzottius varieornatus TaxID=947166 RepID=A0A1D1VBB7_RAMVA|nr:hypothetical protein RvY_07353 [Ramazzottius varieornatus]
MSCAVRADLTRWILCFVVTFMLLASDGSSQSVNRAARRTRVGCAQWGQACLGGHFKKRTSEVSSNNDLLPATGQILNDQPQPPMFRSYGPSAFQLRGWPSGVIGEVPRLASLDEGLIQELSELGLGGLDGLGPEYPRNKAFYNWRYPFMGVGAR